MIHIKRFPLLFILLALSLAACQRMGIISQASATGTPEFIPGQAQVDSLEVLILNAVPVQVQVVVRGTLPDGCTSIDAVSITRRENEFRGLITTTRPAEAVCTEIVLPFERVVPLEVDGLPAGEYAVIINQGAATFRLEKDNLAPTPTPVDGATASIEGQLFHDLCGVAGGTPEQPEVVTEGCEEITNGVYHADGELDPEEPRIPGVQVSLGEGECPQAPDVSSTTDADGVYSFSGLKRGVYCVFIDPLSAQNRPVLIPGVWTAPGPDQAFLEVDLDVGQQITNINFGWDFDRLPPVNFPGCADQAAFIEDITIPDDTIFAPGEFFTKTWRIRNTGSCHWGADYSLVFLAGDRMEGEPVALPTVLAGDQSDISVALRAPLIEGEYRGDWQLQNPADELFGAAGEIDLTYFVKIVVEEPETIGAVIQGIVWDDRCVPASDGGVGEGCIPLPDGSSVADGVLDEGEDLLAGVEVWLYDGSCPPSGSPLVTVTTNELGGYRFAELEPGSYCVTIDETEPVNAALLLPGIWSYPDIDIATITITLEEGDTSSAVDFGWDSGVN
jgi:hypothetical protein